MKEIVTEIKCAVGGKYTVQEVEREIPEPEVQPEEPTEQEDIASMLVDLEYRLTLLEMGAGE